MTRRFGSLWSLEAIAGLRVNFISTESRVCSRTIIIFNSSTWIIYFVGKKAYLCIQLLMITVRELCRMRFPWTSSVLYNSQQPLPLPAHPTIKLTIWKRLGRHCCPRRFPNLCLSWRVVLRLIVVCGGRGRRKWSVGEGIYKSFEVFVANHLTALVHSLEICVRNRA